MTHLTKHRRELLVRLRPEILAPALRHLACQPVEPAGGIHRAADECAIAAAIEQQIALRGPALLIVIDGADRCGRQVERTVNCCAFAKKECAIDGSPIEPQCVTVGLRESCARAIEIAAEMSAMRADLARNRRVAESQIASRIDSVAVDNHPPRTFDPQPDTIEIAAEPRAGETDAAANLGAAQQDSATRFQPVGGDGDAVSKLDDRAVAIEIACEASTTQPDFARHLGSAQRDPAARLHPVRLQSGQRGPVEEKVVDNGRRQNGNRIEAAILETDIARYPTAFEVEHARDPGAAYPHAFLMRTAAFLAAEHEKAQQLRPHGAGGIVLVGPQAIAQPIEVAGAQFGDDFLLGDVEREKVGQTGTGHIGGLWLRRWVLPWIQPLHGLPEPLATRPPSTRRTKSA